VQTVAPLLEAGAQTGSFLTQTYTITNNGAGSAGFELVRYIDGDLLFDGTLVDGGGRLTTSTDILFETDAGGTASTDTTFVGISGTGGTEPATGRFEIDSYFGLGSRIIAGTALDNTVAGDGDADGFIDSGSEYDVTLGLRNVFILAPGASDTYVTRTFFGTGAPEDVGDTTVSIATNSTINIANQGAIPLTIFSTDDFDASTVDVSTVRFAGAAAFQSALSDVDGDGDLDLVLHFRTQQTDLMAHYRDLVIADLADGTLDSNRQSFDALLTGETLDGEAFEGTATINLFLAGRALRDLLEEIV
jgi:hypothetical protein